jgi:hypothetical protein
MLRESYNSGGYSSICKIMTADAFICQDIFSDEVVDIFFESNCDETIRVCETAEECTKSEGYCEFECGSPKIIDTKEEQIKEKFKCL